MFQRRRKIIVISGVSKGIGYAIAQYFAREGFHIIGCAHTKSSLEKLRRLHPQWEVSQADFSQKTQVLNFAKQIKKHHEAIDILVNNVGRFVAGTFASSPDGNLEALLQINLLSAYYFTRELLPTLARGHKPTLFFIDSILSKRPHFRTLDYSISKCALTGFARALRQELTPKNIRVVSVFPGATRSASWQGNEVASLSLMNPLAIAEMLWKTYELPLNSLVEELIITPLHPPAE